jgi:hypothetical protein
MLYKSKTETNRRISYSKSIASIKASRHESTLDLETASDAEVSILSESNYDSMSDIDDNN